jgi:hypothetical protein
MIKNENDDVRCKRRNEMKMMMENKKVVKMIMGELEGSESDDKEVKEKQK